MKKKFSRTSWKQDELFLLRAVYAVNSTPDSENLSSLSVILNKPYHKIKVWFQNSRQRKLILYAVDVEHALSLI